MGGKIITTHSLFSFFLFLSLDRNTVRILTHTYGSATAAPRLSDPQDSAAPSRLPAAQPGPARPPGPGPDLCDGGGRAAARAPPHCPAVAGAGPAEQAARRERPGFRRGAHPPPGGGGERAPGPHGGEGDGKRGAAGRRGGGGALGGADGAAVGPRRASRQA